jgi:hypothetical protein
LTHKGGITSVFPSLVARHGAEVSAIAVVAVVVAQGWVVVVVVVVWLLLLSGCCCCVLLLLLLLLLWLLRAGLLSLLLLLPLLLWLLSSLLFLPLWLLLLLCTQRLSAVLGQVAGRLLWATIQWDAEWNKVWACRDGGGREKEKLVMGGGGRGSA